MSSERESIVSQAVVAVFDRKVLLLVRKHPYGITDNVIYPKNRRQLKPMEIKDIVNYYCGKTLAFEDEYDFPKGRGASFREALKEVREETGYLITETVIRQKIENYYTVTYRGLDDKTYTIVLHVIVLSELPVKVRNGEIRSYRIRWITLDDIISLVTSLKDYDTRNKLAEYLKLLKNISAFV